MGAAFGTTVSALPAASVVKAGVFSHRPALVKMRAWLAGADASGMFVALARARRRSESELKFQFLQQEQQYTAAPARASVQTCARRHVRLPDPANSAWSNMNVCDEAVVQAANSRVMTMAASQSYDS